MALANCGVTLVDYFHLKADSYWTNEFKEFFDPSTGIDVDGIWIDMNEPASVCSKPILTSEYH